MSRLHPHPSLSFVLSLAAWFVGATRNTEGRVPRRSARPLGLFALLTLGLALGTGIAQPTYAATTITVNTTNDDAVTDGHCSLREAIANANANLDNTGGDCMSGSSGS